MATVCDSERPLWRPLVTCGGLPRPQLRLLRRPLTATRGDLWRPLRRLCVTLLQFCSDLVSASAVASILASILVVAPISVMISVLI